MLAVRRSGVTEALNILERRGIIEAKRGNIVVLDRAGLEAVAGDSYGTPEAEYQRLIGPLS
jgi:DNA-binding FadR family transcriptional regulator